MGGEAPPDLDGLRREMWTRQRQARVAVRIYNRGSWIRFTLVFIPVPLVVVTFRLYLEAWHYYILGGAFIFFAGLLYVLDDRAATRREAALKAAKAARATYQEARSSNGARHSSGAQVLSNGKV
ncbi:MAG: hypothetical protein EPO41_25810 [Reyranella sp.]|uniref:hypothetical protein n=1 Tax=Reyranella sp. TaxID=1929291 RepID=UPI001212C120|nr:hypothetical protein [Reyranella sp.]TAJ85714.1 MAG: hypothetical protein EPO41_25810 [Reyranella sp.]